MASSASARMSVSRRLFVILQATLIAATLAIVPAAPVAGPAAAAASDFTLVVLPDTQHYSLSYPATFTAQTNWIVANEASKNIVFVAHEGDLIDGSTTAEWENASASMKVLDDAGVPSSVLQGNHGDIAGYSTYFGESRYTSLPEHSWYGGSMPGKDNRDSYQLFSVGALDFIVVDIEWSPDLATRQWAHDIIAANPSRRAIVVAHDYLTSTGSLATDGTNIWNDVVKDNCNVFMTLNGHEYNASGYAEARLTSENDCGDAVYQVVQNYQDMANGGDGWLRYYTFKPSEGKIYAYTYSPTLDQSRTGDSSQFVLDYDMTTTVPWTAYVDTIEAAGGSAANVLTLTPPNGTTCSAPCDPYPSTDAFALKDYADGSALPVSMQVDGNVDVVSNNPTSDPFTTARGDETAVFGGIVSAQGAYSFTNAAGRKFDLNFTGLDDTKTYTIVVGSDRFDSSGSNQYRWSQFQLTGAGAFTQPATTITNAYIVGDAGASVAFNTGNNTQGYVARWTGVVPVGGAFSVVTNYFVAPTGTTNTSSYPPSALMIAEEGPSGPSAPGAPTGLTATGGNTTADLSWTAPASDGGSPITDYQVTPYVGATAQTPVLVGSAATSTTVTGLTNGTTYTFKVAAINTNGTGAQSTASNAVTPQVPPVWTAYVDLRSSTGDNNAANVLEIPEGASGSPIDAATSFTLLDLSSGLDTDARLQIDNSGINTTSDNGASSTGGPAAALFGGIVDGQGVYSFNEAGDIFQLNLSGLDPAKRYTVALTTNRDENATPERWVDLTLLGTDASTEASGGTTTVVDPTHVRFQARYNTTRGDIARWTGIDPGADGAFSIKTSLYLDAADRSYAPVELMLAEEGPSGPTAPGAPTGVTATGGNTTADLSWTAPASDGGSAITDYQVTPYVGATAQTPVLVGSAATATTVTGLTNGTTYTFKVAAINTNGTGPDSAASNAVTPQAPLDNWTAYADLRTSSNSNNNAANVLEIPEDTIDAYGTGSPINPATSFTLLDLASGRDTDARLQVDNSGLYISSDNGSSFTGGPAFDVFGGIVDGAGVFSEQAGAIFQVNLSGLDPAKRYTVVATSNRDQDPAARGSDPNGDERWTDLELVGADASTQASGGTTTVVSPTHVRFGSENNTARGDYGRWTDIDPGADGAFSVKSNVYLNGNADRSYVPVQLMLQETTPSAPGSHTVGGTVTAGGDPVEGAVVYVFTASDSSYAGNAVTAADGTYGVELPDGSYKLWIQTNTGGYPDQAYGPDGTFENATVIDTTGADAAADVVLAAAPTSHTISGTVTAGGSPVEGAIVYVFRTADSGYAGNAVTAADGTYGVSLPDDSYKLWIQTNTPDYPDQAYGPDGTFETATPVVLAGGNQTADVVLAVRIHGTITAGGDPVEGAVVYVYHAGTDAYAGNAVTAADGTYSISLAPGTYKLWIQTNTPGLPRPGLRSRRHLRERHGHRHHRGQRDRGRRPRGRRPRHRRHRHRRRRSRQRCHRLRVQGIGRVLCRQRGHRGGRQLHHLSRPGHLQALDPDQHRRATPTRPTDPTAPSRTPRSSTPPRAT